MRNHDGVIDGWEVLTEEEAIDAAIDKYGKDPTTSVAYCTFAADDGRKGPEYRFWFDLFLKRSKADHVGWAQVRFVANQSLGMRWKIADNSLKP